LGPVNGSLYEDDSVEGVIAEGSLDTYLDPPVKGSEYADADAEDAVEAEGRCRDDPISSRAPMKGRVLGIQA
jgi:hypothetical protein